MTTIFKLQCKGGAEFRVTTRNRSQVKRLNKIIDGSKGGAYEIINATPILNGVQSIGEFEKLAPLFD